MNEKQNAIEWLKASKDDLDAITELLKNPSLTNVVAFHTQQAIEKSFKAVLEFKRIGFVKTHNLERLYSKIEDVLFLGDLKELELINEIYIDTRYPGDNGLLPSGKPTLEEAYEFNRFAWGVFDKVCTIVGVDKKEFE